MLYKKYVLYFLFSEKSQNNATPELDPAQPDFYDNHKLKGGVASPQSTLDPFDMGMSYT